MSNFTEYEEWRRKLNENGITGSLIDQVIQEPNVRTQSDFVKRMMFHLEQRYRFKDEFNIDLSYVSFRNYRFKKDSHGGTCWCTPEVEHYISLTIQDSNGRCTLL